jgi:outer membrane receptor protein involved in Fe transport
VTIHYRHSDNSTPNPFPTLGGSSTSSAWDIPVSYSFTKVGIFSTLRFGFNRQHSEATNLFAGVQNIAGDAGLQGVSSDSFDWGAPTLSFGKFASLRDTSPSARTDQTISFGDNMTKTRGKQTLHFGGDYRSIRADSRTDANARGSFVFTGLYTGSDFGDFLLGLPQQSTAQFGPGLEQFRETSWDLFLQDDWRTSAKLTVNAGLRYEYYSPYSEASNRLATLDVTPDFTAATPVQAGQTGPYSGALPDTIVHPFRAGLAPRIGIAWKPKPSTTVRTGYGINYSNSTYASIAQQLAAQPPFATTDQVLSKLASPVPLESVLTTVVPGATNTYAVDPNYRMGYVQIWSFDVQRDFIRTISTGITYVGTRGSNLDLLRAPNRDPNGGLRITGVQPFIWESSGAESIMHSVSFRVRRRLTKGIAAGANYTLSKSIDNASSIGGGGGVVAQNDLDLAAERGLSSFDQRHRASGDFTLELPFGANKRWLNNGAAAALLGSWVFNGSVQLASGTPFTARVLASASDVSRGTNGTLRANYNGQPISVSDPTTTVFFNTGAFSLPAPGTFGNAGRNTIAGPGTSNMNLSLTRNLSFGQTRGMSIQIAANNVFNTVQFSQIDTVVNSSTFGQVTGVRAMRRVQIVTRFRF